MKYSKISIEDNWFSDIYPTFCDWFSRKIYCFTYKYFGYEAVKREPFSKFLAKVRVYEIVLFRKGQMKYTGSNRLHCKCINPSTNFYYQNECPRHGKL